MKNSFERIEGLFVLDISQCSDEVCFLFSNDAVLMIYNIWTLVGAESLGALVGKKICRIDFSEFRVDIFFELGLVFEVDVSDDGYNGPEAMCLYFPGENICVWN